jgi:hypothetical protein
MDMPWPAARDFASAAARLDRERLLHLAIASRAAQAEEKAWKDWVREIGRENQ